MHYFSSTTGQVTGRWVWAPGSAEVEEAAEEPPRAATPGLQICYPYMLLSGVSAEFEVHLAMPEAAHTDVMTVRIPEALDDTESIASTATAGGLPWRRNRRLLEPGVLFTGSMAGEEGPSGAPGPGGTPPPGTVAAVSRGSCIVQVRLATLSQTSRR